MQKTSVWSFNEHYLCEVSGDFRLIQCVITEQLFYKITFPLNIQSKTESMYSCVSACVCVTKERRRVTLYVTD